MKENKVVSFQPDNAQAKTTIPHKLQKAMR